MNRAAFGVGMFALLPLPAVGAILQRVAISVSSADGTAQYTDLDRVAARLGGAFIKSRKYSVVDRARLMAVIREQGFSNSMYADPKTAAALGKILGASRLLHVELSIQLEREDGPFLTVARQTASSTFTFVGVDTARILAQGTADGQSEKQFARGSPLTQLSASRREAVDACVDDIVQQVVAS